MSALPVLFKVVVTRSMLLVCLELSYAMLHAPCLVPSDV